MATKFSVSYMEEDGFPITRDGIEYMVYGTCEGEYSRWHIEGRMTLKNGDPGFPSESGMDQESFDCWVDTVTCDGEEIEFTLTDAEMDKFETYMSGKLDTEAEEFEN